MEGTGAPPSIRRGVTITIGRPEPYARSTTSGVAAQVDGFMRSEGADCPGESLIRKGKMARTKQADR